MVPFCQADASCKVWYHSAKQMLPVKYGTILPSSITEYDFYVLECASKMPIMNLIDLQLQLSEFNYKIPFGHLHTFGLHLYTIYVTGNVFIS